jgi:hypothetical protein
VHPLFVGDFTSLRTPIESLEVLIPILYLKGISTGDFEEALLALLGKDADGHRAGQSPGLSLVRCPQPTIGAPWCRWGGCDTISPPTEHNDRDNERCKRCQTALIAVVRRCEYAAYRSITEKREQNDQDQAGHWPSTAGAGEPDQHRKRRSRKDKNRNVDHV